MEGDTSMKKIYITPESNWMQTHHVSDVLQMSSDVSQDGSSVKIDNEDTGGNAWSGGRSNNGLWDDPDEME
jgi:hypothetical protein